MARQTTRSGMVCGAGLIAAKDGRAPSRMLIIASAGYR